ncbi:MAG: DUF2007 domain-containing protein [Terriglobia bacterium]|jgi:hypothetical protein
MPYCPQCFIEYVEGTKKCEDCGSDLQPGSPPEAPPRVEITNEKDVKLVSVRTFAGGTAQMDADLARNILQSQGIPCVQSGQGAANVLPVLDVHMLVREEDAERAATVLEEYLDTDTAADTDGGDSTEGG